MIASATSMPTFSCASSVLAPRCGVSTTFSRPNSGWSLAGGSLAYTSSPAARIEPFFKASISAGSSTTEPRDMLMTMPRGPSASSTSALTRCLVEGPPGVIRIRVSTSRAMSTMFG